MGAVDHLVEDFPLPVEPEVGQRRETQTLPFVERLPRIIVCVPLLAQMRRGGGRIEQVVEPVSAFPCQ